MTSHLFTLGGSGWHGPKGGPNRMLLEMLRMTGKKRPKVCLVHTAQRETPEGFLAFADMINSLGAHPNFLSLYRTPSRDLEDWVMDFDAMFVAGGNTRSLLVLWKAWELDRILIAALARGVVIAGESAGANCWYEQGLSDFIAGELNPLACLGLLEGSCCPHYADHNGRRPLYLQMVKDGRLKVGHGISDRAGLHYEDGKLKEAVIEWEEAGVYRVERGADGEVVETRLPARVV